MIIYYVLLAVSIILIVLKSSLYNAFAKKTLPTLKDIFAFNSISYFIAAFIGFIVFLLSVKTISLPTILCAIGYAVIVFSLQTLSVNAMKDGAMSLTSICVMYGMILPSIAGPIFWGETFCARQGIGIVLMMVSLGLLGITKKTDTQKISKKWIVLAVFCFILSGFAGIMEKIHQSTSGRPEKAGFVLIACLCMFAFSISLRLFSNKNKLAPTESKKPMFSKPILIFGAISGAVIGAVSIVNLTLSGALDSMIYYPVSNGGALLLTVLVSGLFFKESFNKQKILGILMGLVGMILLSIPV